MAADATADHGRRRWRAPLLLVLFGILAYLPSLGGGFLSDDFRFVADNPAVKELSLRQAARFFTEPRSQATVGYDIYRPLRTLDFAIDWSIAGDSPTFFRVRNLLYHALGVLLVLALLRRLLRDERRDLRAPAFLGAALFALHPVHTESVAFVSSRGDLLLLVFFVAALVLHLEGRRRAATVAFVLALFSREVAVVFPAVAFLADSFLRRRRAWGAYVVYASLAAAFAGLWLLLVPGSDAPGLARRPGWSDDSWTMNLVTVGKGLLYDAKELTLPVDLAFDWHVPSRTTAAFPDVALAVAGFGVFLLALFAGRRARFASLWFLATILPVLGLLVPMTNPTAKRFLLLPSVGFCFLVAPLLSRTRLSFVVMLSFLALPAARSTEFTSLDALTDATLRRSRGPIPLAREAMREYEEMSRTGTEEDARDVVAAVNAWFRLFAEDIQAPVPRGGDAPLAEGGGPARPRRAAEGPRRGDGVGPARRSGRGPRDPERRPRAPRESRGRARGAGEGGCGRVGRSRRPPSPRRALRPRRPEKGGRRRSRRRARALSPVVGRLPRRGAQRSGARRHPASVRGVTRAPDPNDSRSRAIPAGRRGA